MSQDTIHFLTSHTNLSNSLCLSTTGQCTVDNSVLATTKFLWFGKIRERWFPKQLGFRKQYRRDLKTCKLPVSPGYFLENHHVSLGCLSRWEVCCPESIMQHMHQKEANYWHASGIEKSIRLLWDGAVGSGWWQVSPLLGHVQPSCVFSIILAVL